MFRQTYIIVIQTKAAMFKQRGCLFRQGGTFKAPPHLPGPAGGLLALPTLGVADPRPHKAIT